MVYFTTDKPGSLSSPTCTLSGSGDSASCSVSYIPPSSTGWHVITGGYAGNSTFASSWMNTTVTVNPKTPIITFNATSPASPVYRNTFMVSASANSGGTISYSYVSGPCSLLDVWTGIFSSTGVGICRVQATVAATGDYSSGSNTLDIAIGQATPMITFGAVPSATYPGSDFIVSATTDSDGALTYSKVSGPCTQVSGGSFTPTGAGSCVIQASTTATTNFIAASETQDVTITSGILTPTITFNLPLPTPTYLGGNFTADATTDSDGDVTYSVDSGPCSISDPSVPVFSSTGAGVCDLRASVAATTNFNSANDTASVTVAQATPTITFDVLPTPTYLGGNFTVTASADSGAAMKIGRAHV